MPVAALAPALTPVSPSATRVARSTKPSPDSVAAIAAAAALSAPATDAPPTTSAMDAETAAATWVSSLAQQACVTFHVSREATSFWRRSSAECTGTAPTGDVETWTPNLRMSASPVGCSARTDMRSLPSRAGVQRPWAPPLVATPVPSRGISRTRERGVTPPLQNGGQ